MRILSRKEFEGLEREAHLIRNFFEDEDIEGMMELEELANWFEEKGINAEIIMVNDNHIAKDIVKDYDPTYSYYIVKKGE